MLGQVGSQGSVENQCPALLLSYPVSKAPSSVSKKTHQGRGGRGHVHHLLMLTPSLWGIREPPLPAVQGAPDHCSLGPLQGRAAVASRRFPFTSRL